MTILWPLLFWIFRPLRWLTIFSVIGVTLYLLFQDQPLDFRRDSYVITFVLVHSFLISRLIGRVRSESFADLYSQGFSRNVIWSHCWLATLASVLITWLPAAILIVSPLRGQLQNALQNPWFPLMASTEWPYLCLVGLLYALVLPVFHYEWIRSAAPFRELISGHLLAIGYFVFAATVFDRFWQMSHRWWIPACFMTVSLILGVLGRWLHQRIEVYS